MLRLCAARRELSIWGRSSKSARCFHESSKRGCYLGLRRSLYLLWWLGTCSVVGFVGGPVLLDVVVVLLAVLAVEKDVVDSGRDVDGDKVLARVKSTKLKSLVRGTSIEIGPVFRDRVLMNGNIVRLNEEQDDKVVEKIVSRPS